MKAASASLGAGLGVHFMPAASRRQRGQLVDSLVCILFAGSISQRCPPSVCTFSQSAAALYAHFLQTKRGGLVYALFGGCGSVPGVRLVYALFGEIRNKYRKECRKEGRFMYVHYGGKSVPPSVCTLWREKRSPAPGIARRRAERVSG